MRCPACGATNRVPRDKIDQGLEPVCGRCKTPLPVLLDMWAVWCGPCQMVAPVIEELSKEYAGKMKVRKLNTDENPEVAGRYQVMSIPTILFFKNGQVVEKLVGARPKRQFKEMIDSLLAQPAGSA